MADVGKLRISIFTQFDMNQQTLRNSPMIHGVPMALPYFAIMCGLFPAPMGNGFVSSANKTVKY